MSNDLYALIYKGEVIYASKDEELLQEIMYDMFIADVMQHFNSRVDNTVDYNKLARISWEVILNWYDDYVNIIKISKNCFI